MNHITYFIFLIIISVVFALQEIQIEGKDGWAKNLPTWKKYLNKKGILGLFVASDRPITGYHVYTFSLLLILLHTAFLFTSWSLRNEILILSLYVNIMNFEDFFWFVFNPAYGIKKFKHEYIPWHTSWTLGIPTNYWIGIIAGVALYILAYSIK